MWGLVCQKEKLEVDVELKGEPMKLFMDTGGYTDNAGNWVLDKLKLIKDRVTVVQERSEEDMNKDGIGVVREGRRQ